jgi:hypothetical protein
MPKYDDKKNGRFRIYVSERSGFEFGFIPITSLPNAYTREAGKPVQDVNILVAPTEYDSPPPSKRPLGGVGDISNGNERQNSNFADPANVYVTPPPSPPVVYYVTSSQPIPWNTDPVVYVGGSNQDVVMASNPQLSPGEANRVIALQCVGSNITLNSSNGLTFDFQRTPFLNMTSGSIATIIWNATDSTWHVTSFNPKSGGF